MDKTQLYSLILRETLKERELEEDYPSTFDMEHFRSLSTFKDRVEYASQHLTRIASGSSRIVYKIDEEKALKLAKNKKGLAQNEVEADMSDDPVAGDIFAKVYDHDEDFRWIEMELVKKLSKKKFEQIVGVKFDDFGKMVENYGLVAHGKDPLYEIPDEIEQKMWDNEFVYDVLDYVGNFNVSTGDLTRPSSYGITGNGEERVVLVDYGLSSDVEQEYYK